MVGYFQKEEIQILILQDEKNAKTNEAGGST